eukprot:TRINITY_DN2078_c0_g1_i1.p1 TRINITY_DN2078_c0_g1~~TRINITY_DN2078_c0_g1_i1.p1  ORF type:complete len:1031 (-),score=374.94 TRINITY_DN2078_c0_g1_i1:82-2991(-)
MTADALIKEKNERLAFLENELRAAKSTLENYSSMEKRTVRKAASSDRTKDVQPNKNKEQLKPQELRALNFIVRKYLVDEGYKLSAITLEEEADDQELTDWSEVGLATSEPPPLIQFYRQFYIMGQRNERGAAGGLMKAQQENDVLKTKLANAEQRFDQLAKRYEDLLKSKEEGGPAPTSDGKRVLLRADSLLVRPQTAETTNAGQPLDEKESRFFLRKTFADVDEISKTLENRTEENESYTRITHQLINLAKRVDWDNHSVIQLVAGTLPYVVPGVILKKREELVPLFLPVIAHHPDQNVRYDLTKLFFNLIKKPDEYERKIIVDGFIGLANLTSEERIETELLPQCWEEVGNKNFERRVLIADTVTALAPYVRPELRPSLILSILQQLIEDKKKDVRAGAARNLGLLVSLFEGEEKYSQLEDILFKLLYDFDEDVQNMVKTVFLPLFADWADMTGNLCTSLMTRIINDLQAVISQREYEHTAQINTSEDVERLMLLCDTIQILLPRMRDAVFTAAPFSKPILAKAPQQSTFTQIQEIELKKEFDKFLDMKPPNAPTWTEWQFVVTFAVPKLAECSIGCGNSNPEVIAAVAGLLRTLCLNFGAKFSEKIVKSHYEYLIQQTAQEFQTRGWLLPGYLLGILETGGPKEFAADLKELTICVALSEAGWSKDHHNSILKESLCILCAKFPGRRDEVLNVMNEVRSHGSANVRACVASILTSLVSVVTAEQVSEKVLPCLEKLTGDGEKVVRLITIHALGTVAITVEDEKILEKISMQLDKFMEDASKESWLELSKVLGAMIPNVHPNFREQYIIPRLLTLTEKTAGAAKSGGKSKILQALFESFRACNGTRPHDDTISKYILPGLTLIFPEAEPSYKTVLESMIHEYNDILRKEDKSAQAPPVAKPATGWMPGMGGITMGMNIDLKSKMGLPKEMPTMGMGGMTNMFDKNKMKNALNFGFGTGTATPPPPKH